MCGILAIIGKFDPELAQQLSGKMGHRGPDETGVEVTPEGHVLCHERLSIVDLKTGKQPIRGSKSSWVIHNGEIYNHEELRKTEVAQATFRTQSDSEVIVHLYEKYGYDFCDKLDGMFAFVVVDGDKYMAARDPLGIKPLYYGKDTEGRMFFASEMKSLAEVCDEFAAFPPGHYYTAESGFVRYFYPVWEDHAVADKPVEYTELREALEAAVEKRLMADVPLGVLLSGGLDSSLVSSIVARKLRGTDQELHSFSIGLTPDAPDLKAARKVADHIGTTHHEITFTVEEGIQIIKQLVWHLETYDVTSIRASTPMYFLSKYIADLGVKVVLSGEGADEIFGGYLYFHNAPSATDFQKETVRRVFRLSTADLLRADKSTMAHGLEARVPFLDKDFLDVAMKIRPEDKQPSRKVGKPEKHPLRMAFYTPDDPYLPASVLWRQKEQFSDGVGYSWIDSLIAHCESMVTDAELAMAEERFPINPPTTKEAYYYRCIFEAHYPQADAAKTVQKWIPKWQKNTDPSGRAAAEHVQFDPEIALEITQSGLKKTA